MKETNNYYELLSSLEENGGATLHNGKPVHYSVGYQVADTGIETDDIKTAAEAIKAFNGNAGLWYSGGVYYIDHSLHIINKSDAI